MKKLIQIGSLASLLVLFSVATFAQSSYGADVNIPFAFAVGDHSYEAGNYIVRFDKLPSGPATLTIVDTKTEETQKVLMNSTGDGGSGDLRLVFDTVEGQRRLTSVKTPDRSYAIFKSKAEKDARKARIDKAVETSGGANLF